MIISYRQPDTVDLTEIDDYPDVVRSLVVLEAPGTGYCPFASQRCRVAGSCRECDVHEPLVASENTAARALYEYLGYRKVLSSPVVEYPGCLHCGDRELMIKQLA
ncbi:MAG: hypothetical protein AAF402_09970 [Pseudomonadota bacterium]